MSAFVGSFQSAQSHQEGIIIHTTGAIHCPIDTGKHAIPHQILCMNVTDLIREQIEAFVYEFCHSKYDTGMDHVGYVEAGHDPGISYILSQTNMRLGAVDGFRIHILDGNLDLAARSILTYAFECIDRSVPAFTAPVQRMRCVSIGIHTARMRENQLASHFFRSMNGINNMSLPPVGIRVGGNNIAGAVKSIKDNIIRLQLRFNLSDFRFRQFSADPFGRSTLARRPSAGTHCFEDAGIIRPLSVGKTGRAQPDM